MSTYEHVPSGIQVSAENIDHACELIELEFGVSDDGRSNGTRVQVDREDVSCLTDLDFDAVYEERVEALCAS